MANETILNKINNNVTSINRLNDKIANPIGHEINGFLVTEKIFGNSGEADLFICTKSNQNYVLKVYRRKNSVKTEIIDLLRTIHNKHIATVIDNGIFDGYQYVILPYYKNGSLANIIETGNLFSLSDLRETVICQLNEALNTLHCNNIIHKDLKPSNVMVDDDGNLVVIDFGLSSVTDKDRTVLITKTGMTPTYLAPEAFHNTYTAETDYYALGIMLYELFTGRTPYQNLSLDEAASYASVQKIPFPEDFPEDLKTLVLGLTYKDITFRNDIENPNRRWTYNEVRNWLNYVEQPIPGKNIENASISQTPAYKFNNNFYKNTNDLVIALLENWELGKKEFCRGFLTRHFENTNNLSLISLCNDAEKQYLKNKEKLDFIFFDLMYSIGTKIETIYFKKQKFKNLDDLGNNLFNKVIKSVDASVNDIINLIRSNCFDKYIQSNALSESVSESIKRIRLIITTDDNDTMNNALRICYALTGKTLFIINSRKYLSVEEFANYMQELEKKDLASFVDECNNGTNDIENIKNIYGNNIYSKLKSVFWDYHKMSKILGFNQKCPNCNSLLPNLATHCMQCGWNLNISDVRTTKCHKCGKELRVFEKFCPNCGQPKNSKYYQPIICKKCKREITWDSKVCNYCQTPIKESLFLEHIKSHKLYFSFFYMILIIASVTTIYISHYFTQKNVHNSYNEIIQSSENANKELTEKIKILTNEINENKNNTKLILNDKNMEIDELKKDLEKKNNHIYKLNKDKETREHYALQLQKQQKESNSSSYWKKNPAKTGKNITFMLTNNSEKNSIILECDGDNIQNNESIMILANKQIFYGSDAGLEFFIDKSLYYPSYDSKWRGNNDTWNKFIDALFNGNQIGVFIEGNIIAAFSPSKDNISKFKSMAKYCHKRK